jgi:hypothetical protein
MKTSAATSWPADSVAKAHSTRPRLRIGYLVVLAGAVGFVASCFVP